MSQLDIRDQLTGHANFGWKMHCFHRSLTHSGYSVLLTPHQAESSAPFTSPIDMAPTLRALML